MNLILSSCDFRNEKSKKTILDTLRKPIGQCKLLFIPNEKATQETIHSEKYYIRLQAFGFSRENITVFDYADPQKFIDLDLDILYISGGNTFTTLKRIRDCGFDQEILRYVQSGVLYIGGSAGAHIATKSIAHVAAFDPIPDGMNDWTGLGLFDGILICHYTEERRPLYEALTAAGKYHRVYALRDEDSLIVNSITEEVIRHYDLLIDENNDPVHDPEPLRNYMNQWDGQPFMDALHLDKEKSVLEIGVGTGRLAVRAAPNCREFCGIDLSPKTIARAKENLKGSENVTLICGDFMGYAFEQKFDVIYSSLTFMHIKDKQAAIRKAKTLLHDGGRFVLSMDKSQRDTIDYGTRKIRIYPDNQEDTLRYIRDSGMDLATLFETESATVFCCTIRKERS